MDDLKLVAPVAFDDSLELNEVRLVDGTAYMSHETLRENIRLEIPPRAD